MSDPADLVREAVVRLPPYRGLTGERPPVLLDGNENPLGPSPAVTAAWRSLEPSVLARYPAVAALRAQWAARLKVKPAEVLLTSGSGPALAIAAELVLGPGDGCVLAAPSFELYGWAAERREARIVAVPCLAGRGFEFPLEGFRAAVEDAAVPPRMVVIGHPDNPTGAAPPVEFVTRLAGAHPRTLFLIDEAYAEFYGRTLVPQAVKSNNILVTRTFSKALGLAGERIGGLIGPAPLIELAARINVPYPVTAAAVPLALAALEDQAHVTETVRLSRRAVRRLEKEVTGAGLPTRATRANFVLVNAGSGPRAAALTAGLARRGVAIRNRSHLAGMAGWVRISAGQDEEIDSCLDAIRLLTAPEPDALLFDMDGVLVDVTASYDEAIVRTVASFLPGRELDRAAVLSVKQRPDANDDIDASCIALARLGQKPPRREVARRFDELYRGTRGKPGLHRKEKWLLPAAALRRLAARMPLGIVTGRPRDEARLALRAAGTSRFFKVVVTLDDVRPKKPDPAPYRAALRRLGVAAPWVIGDGPADLIAARRAGLPAIGIRGAGSQAASRTQVLRPLAPLALLAEARELVQVFEDRDRYREEAGE